MRTDKTITRWEAETNYEITAVIQTERVREGNSVRKDREKWSDSWEISKVQLWRHIYWYVLGVKERKESRVPFIFLAQETASWHNPSIETDRGVSLENNDVLNVWEGKNLAFIENRKTEVIHSSLDLPPDTNDFIDKSCHSTSNRWISKASLVFSEVHSSTCVDSTPQKYGRKSGIQLIDWTY